MPGAVQEKGRSTTPTGCSSCSTRPCATARRHAALLRSGARATRSAPSEGCAASRRAHRKRSAQRCARTRPGASLSPPGGGPTHRVCTGSCQPPEARVCSTGDTDKREASKPIGQTPRCHSHCRHILPTPGKSRRLFIKKERGRGGGEREGAGWMRKTERRDAGGGCRPGAPRSAGPPAQRG